MNKPNFSKGNKSFIEAANTLADYAQSVGVNPGGAPGWVHTPTGWQPPGSANDFETRQWRLRVAGDEESPIAQVWPGTVYGLGLGGYIDEMTPDEWLEVTYGKSYWLKFEITISGSPYTYYLSDGTAETIYIPDQVDSVSATLEERDIDETGPAGQAPTVDGDDGSSTQTGIYWFRLGVVGDEVVRNDYLGPLGIAWCPPNSATLTELT